MQPNKTKQIITARIPLSATQWKRQKCDLAQKLEFLHCKAVNWPQKRTFAERRVQELVYTRTCTPISAGSLLPTPQPLLYPSTYPS